MLELRAVDEGAVPASAPTTSRLFVLPVATRQWVLTDNTCVKAFRGSSTFITTLVALPQGGGVKRTILPMPGP